MQSWNHIIQTAMLGTDKKEISTAELDADIAAVLDGVKSGADDKEEFFLSMAAVAFNYRQCGVQPLAVGVIDQPVAGAETAPYCNAAAVQALNDILLEENERLLRLWVQSCSQKDQLAPPYLLPKLMDVAVKHKSLAPLIFDCSGARGAWLVQFNTNWQMLKAEGTDEEIWQTGTTEQRKAVWKKIRAADADRGRQWLEQTWPQEGATAKAELLQLMQQHLSPADAPWLESLLTEKSSKVKEAALNLLKSMPGSTLVQQYWQAVKRTVTLKKKKSLEIQLPADIDEAVYKTGIDKLSNVKGLSDEAFIISQLIAAVPPRLWEEHLDESPARIFDLFKATKVEAWLAALVAAVVRFKDERWAAAIGIEKKQYYPELLPVLSKQGKEDFLNHHAASINGDTVMYVTGDEEEWSLSMTRSLFKAMTQSVYQFHRGFFNEHIHLIPIAFAAEIDHSFSGDEMQRSSFTYIVDHLKKLLSIKAATSKAFAPG